MNLLEEDAMGESDEELRKRVEIGVDDEIFYVLNEADEKARHRPLLRYS